MKTLLVILLLLGCSSSTVTTKNMCLWKVRYVLCSNTNIVHEAVVLTEKNDRYQDENLINILTEKNNDTPFPLYTTKSSAYYTICENRHNLYGEPVCDIPVIDGDTSSPSFVFPNDPVVVIVGTNVIEKVLSDVIL